MARRPPIPVWLPFVVAGALAVVVGGAIIVGMLFLKRLPHQADPMPVAVRPPPQGNVAVAPAVPVGLRCPQPKRLTASFKGLPASSWGEILKDNDFKTHFEAVIALRKMSHRVSYPYYIDAMEAIEPGDFMWDAHASAASLLVSPDDNDLDILVGHAPRLRNHIAEYSAHPVGSQMHLFAVNMAVIHLICWPEQFEFVSRHPEEVQNDNPKTITAASLAACLFHYSGSRVLAPADLAKIETPAVKQTAAWSRIVARER